MHQSRVLPEPWQGEREAERVWEGKGEVVGAGTAATAASTPLLLPGNWLGCQHASPEVQVPQVQKSEKTCGTSRSYGGAFFPVKNICLRTLFLPLD